MQPCVVQIKATADPAYKDYMLVLLDSTDLTDAQEALCDAHAKLRLLSATGDEV